jgi:putative FmdB family regulatory protein
MPIYEYRHTAERGPECAEVFEVLQTMSDEPLSACPTCGKPVEKLISAFLPHKNIMSAGNLRDKGFTKLTRRDKGVYERET